MRAAYGSLGIQFFGKLFLRLFTRLFRRLGLFYLIALGDRLVSFHNCRGGRADRCDRFRGRCVDASRLGDQVTLKLFKRALLRLLVHARHDVLSEVEDALKVAR